MSSAYITLATTVSIGNLSSPGDATPAIHVDYQQLRTLRILVQKWWKRSISIRFFEGPHVFRPDLRRLFDGLLHDYYNNAEKHAHENDP